MLNFLLCQLHPFTFPGVLADHYGARLKPIELIKVSLVRHVAYEVIHVALLVLARLVLLKYKGMFPLKTVVQHTNGLGVAEGQTTILAA